MLYDRVDVRKNQANSHRFVPPIDEKSQIQVRDVFKHRGAFQKLLVGHGNDPPVVGPNFVVNPVHAQHSKPSSTEPSQSAPDCRAAMKSSSALGDWIDRTDNPAADPATTPCPRAPNRRSFRGSRRPAPRSQRFPGTPGKQSPSGSRRRPSASP